MNKIIAKEVRPSDVDFSFYFDDDGLKSIGGENCACFILPIDRYHSGFNAEEFQKIQDQAECIIEGFKYVSDKWTNGYNSYSTYKEVMEFNGVPYTSKRCHLLKEWVKTADTGDADSIAEYLTITTKEKWNVRSFRGYSQGDYCQVVYCTAHHSEERINEIGNFWLGCGTEFIIDSCGGYYILDSIRWKEGEVLRNTLANIYGCQPNELEIHLYKGEHIVCDYEMMM